MEQQLFKLPKQHKRAIIKGLKLQIYQVSETYQQVNFEIPDRVRFDTKSLKSLVLNIFKRYQINPWVRQDEQHLAFIYPVPDDFNFLRLLIDETESITFADLLDRK